MPAKKYLLMITAAIMTFVLGILFLYGVLENKPDERILQGKLNTTTRKLDACQMKLNSCRNNKQDLRNSFEIILDNYTDLLIDYKNCKNKTEDSELRSSASRIIRVIDGDTFKINLNGTKETVRLIGVDSPEKENGPYEYDNITNTTCLDRWYEKTVEFAEETLENKRVSISFDEQAGKRGHYGRLLTYVEINGENFGELLLIRGYARVYTETDFQKENEYLQLEEIAKSQNIGLWSCRSTENNADREEGKTEEEIIVSEIHEDASGNDWNNLNDEYLAFKNTGNSKINLTGWIVKDQADHAYLFPSFVLDAGDELILRTGSGNDTSEALYWSSGAPVWNNDGDKITLYDSERSKVLEKAY